MRSFISSSSVRLLVFPVALAAAGLLAELYCRQSPRFADALQSYVRDLTFSASRNAVFGDSQVGTRQHIPDFDFFGQVGQQPIELLRVVQYRYASRHPGDIIVEASPQWFGEYHHDRKVLIDSNALPPSWTPVPLLSSSSFFYRALKANLTASIKESFAFVPAAKANDEETADLTRPSFYELQSGVIVWQNWREGRSDDDANWGKFAFKPRLLLTRSRVYAQNPVAGFAESAAAKQYEAALDLLLTRGGRVCLYRTPVTREYERYARIISGSRYAEFDSYIRALAARKGLRFVSFHDLDIEFADSRFMNQDHLTDSTAHQVWPRVADACFSSGAATGADAAKIAGAKPAAPNPWLQQLGAGGRMLVNLTGQACGLLPPAMDCNAQYSLVLRNDDGRWCETVWRVGGDVPDGSSRCNTVLEEGLLSMYGARFSVDDQGALFIDERQVGQLAVAPPPNQWQNRLAAGEQVIVSLSKDACGVVPSALQCDTSYALTLRRIEGRWCEDVRIVGSGVQLGARCNAPVEASLISLLGARFSFDAAGDLFFENHAVGHLAAGK